MTEWDPLDVPRNLKNTEPGHTLRRAALNTPYPSHPTLQKMCFTCDCGFMMQLGADRPDGRYYHVNAKGIASSYLARQWEGHLAAVADAGLTIEVGTIQMVGRTHTLLVMPMSDAIEQGWEFGAHSMYVKKAAWAVAKQTKTKGGILTRKVVAGYADKPDAIWKAEDVVTKAKRSGREVTYLRESTIKPSSEQVTYRFLELADEALATRSIHLIEDARGELETFFSLLPIIEAKRDAIEDLRNELLLGV